jgi:hypothetical protein
MVRRLGKWRKGAIGLGMVMLLTMAAPAVGPVAHAADSVVTEPSIESWGDFLRGVGCGLAIAVGPAGGPVGILGAVAACTVLLADVVD